MANGIVQGLDYFLGILQYALIAYCIISWVVPPYHRFRRTLDRFMDPLLRPIRNLLFRLFPRMAVDFSTLVVFCAIILLRQGLWRMV